MAHIVADRVKETSTTTSTGTYALAGAVAGFQAFSAKCANNDTVFYAAFDSSGWEIGLGTWTTGNNLARTTILASSNADAAVNWSAGTRTIILTAAAARTLMQNNELAIPIAPVTAKPVAPTTGVKFYARSRAGRLFMEMVGPSGLDFSFQPALFGNNVQMWLPGTGTTAAIAFGVNWTTSATQAHPTIANTSIMTAMLRATFTTTTTAGNTSGVRTGAPCAIRNRGFFFFARFGILTYTSTMRICIGLNGASGAMGGDPSAINDGIYCGKDTGETTWQVATRDTTAASKTSSGRTTAAAGDTNIFDFMAFCKPADSKITVRMVDCCDDTVLIDNVEKSSNLPTNTTVLYAHAECNNQAGGAGSAVAIFLNRIYIESDR